MKRPFSVVNGRDKDVLPILISVHAKESPRILDCTYNKGRMWKGTEFKPVRMDINSEYEVDVIADFKKMPFTDGSFDVIVFDPPHLPDDTGSTTIYTKYGVQVKDECRKGDNISALFIPFLLEAKRVLSSGGIVLAKIADLIHNHRYQWQQVDFINAVRDVGMTPCDMIIKQDPCAGNLMDTRWVNVRHVRKCHCYWIVVRNSKRCEK